jgi:hypothetical protein
VIRVWSGLSRFTRSTIDRMSSPSNVGSPQWMSLTCALRRGMLAMVMGSPPSGDGA